MARKLRSIIITFAAIAIMLCALLMVAIDLRENELVSRTPPKPVWLDAAESLGSASWGGRS